MLSPVMAAAAAPDGKKHFNEGMKHESAEEWDKAVEEFALAVSETPKNPEYRLHLTRALFNASQMFMKKGTSAANEKDYVGGYAAFRRAYAFDPTNELAHSEMERMIRLQKDVGDATPGDKKEIGSNVKLVPTAYTDKKGTADTPIPQKLEKLRDLPFGAAPGINTQFIIKELAKDLDLNVLFDAESFRSATERKTIIELKNVTAAKALDYIFLQEGLFFQKVGPRTIMVATQNQRVKFQQLVLRTFYLANASPKDITKIVQTAIPPQPGRSGTIVLTDDATNSVTIRDTVENIRLIGSLISSLDKDRAEVVMDVAIYEVNRTDLLQLGNQIGTQNQLTNLSGSQSGQIAFGPRALLGTAATATTAAISLPTSIATGIILPSVNLQAFQKKDDTKLIASTQIHAFNNEDSSARIGQRVPVQTAQISNGNIGGVGGGNNSFPLNVVNYEQTGLTLKFKPLVFPNQDVQVAMEIESKDVAGALTATPTFTERTIKGTARIQNNKTLLLASVAQGSESKGRQGLPLLGLIPIIGRLFTAPTRDNRQIDIVIAVTPRVIRAPAILPEDLIERDTGSLAVPTNNSLEAMIIEEDRNELLAAASRMPNAVEVQLPDRQADTAAPTYVKTAAPAANTAAASTTGTAETAVVKPVETNIPNLKPIDTGVKTLQLSQTADISKATDTVDVKAPGPEPAAAQPTPPVKLRLGTDMPEMKAGEKIKIPVMIDGSGKFRSAVMGLTFDPSKIAVRSVVYGDVFGTTAVNTSATPFLNQNGKMYISLTAKDATDANLTGTLAYIEIEALTAGRPVIAFERDVLNFMTVDGKSFAVKFD